LERQEKSRSKNDALQNDGRFDDLPLYIAGWNTIGEHLFEPSARHDGDRVSIDFLIAQQSTMRQRQSCRGAQDRTTGMSLAV
jgi:hypothetical protein